MVPACVSKIYLLTLAPHSTTELLVKEACEPLYALLVYLWIFLHCK